MRLAPLTTLRLGGPAGRLIEAHTRGRARRTRCAMAPISCSPAAPTSSSPTTGIPGTVVLVRTRGVTHERDDLSIVQAGEPWDELVARTASPTAARASSACPASPARPGATPIQNVGAYGQDVSETVAWVRVYDREPIASRSSTLPPPSAGSSTAAASSSTAIAGRSSRSRSGCRESETSGPLRYAELARVLGVPVGGTRPAGRRARRGPGLRRGKGMVIDPADPDSVSAGSFFTNPILTHEAWARAPERARRSPSRTAGSRPPRPG